GVVGSGGDAGRLGVGRRFAALPVRWRLGVLEPAGKTVTAVFGDEIHRHAAAERFGRARGGEVPDLLGHRLVVIRLHGAVTHDAVGGQTVDGDVRAGRANPVHGEVGLLHGARAADVRRGQRDPDNQLAEVLDRPGAGDRVEHFTGKDLRFLIVLDVDDG